MIDRYTKIVLTIIAASLVALVMQNGVQMALAQVSYNDACGTPTHPVCLPSILVNPDAGPKRSVEFRLGHGRSARGHCGAVREDGAWPGGQRCSPASPGGRAGAPLSRQRSCWCSAALAEKTVDAAVHRPTSFSARS